jgi:hypothetical protein
MAITLRAHPAPRPPITITTAILSSAQRLEVLTGVRPLPVQDPFPGADILYVHDRASSGCDHQDAGDLGELGREGAEHRALWRQPLSWSP